LALDLALFGKYAHPNDAQRNMAKCVKPCIIARCFAEFFPVSG